ncbi:pilus assembly protein HicB [Mesorhizobium sp. ASY16-5R]|uniref:pilus assembly protein HicB n=1 Tax=Mesorhizobium sp. ASY16-5R TaxID=3445772 RepID=UPI003FA0FAD2
MSKATFPLKLPLSIKEAAARLAKDDGVSLNQWIASAVAQKVGVVETAGNFLRGRAAAASADDFSDMLKKVPAGPPEPGDELPTDRR